MTTNPYVGPRSFETNETLYGRDRELRSLTDRLISERIVLLHSPSGAGKTSLVQAGLIPQLRAEGFFVHPVIRVNLERSSSLVKITDTLKDARRFNRYTFSTLLSLEERYPAEEHVDMERLARMTLDEYLQVRSKEDKRDGPEFLIFDQFEEVLTIDPTDRTAKNSFFAHLGTTLKNRDRWALFVMRTDYVGALEPFVRAVPTYFANTFHLELLGAKAAFDAIQKPAQKAGVDFTTAAAQKLVDDLRRVQVQRLDGTMESQLGLYIEPVQLQVVCYRLWESKAADDMDINEGDLASVGDVNQSLAEYYALSVAKVSKETGVNERSIREWFDRKLITPDGIRSQVRMGAEASEGLPNTAVRKLEDAHLIRGEKRAGQTWFELAHDRLIEPVRADNGKWFTANLSLFQRQAVVWAEKGRSEGLLLRGQEMEAAEVEAKSLTLTEDETAFLEACRALKQREQRDLRQRRMIVAAFIVSIILFAITIFLGITTNQAKNETVAAKNESVAAAYTAEAANTQAVDSKKAAEEAQKQAIVQQATAQAASTQAYQNQATAVAAQQQAATQQAIAEAKSTEAAKSQADAVAQAQIAKEQERSARANALVAQSFALLYKDPKQAVLLAIAAFQQEDVPSTRAQLLSFVSDSLSLFQNTNSGITTNVSYGLDNSMLVSSNYYDCSPDTLYTCGGSALKIWKVSLVNGNVTSINQDNAFDSVLNNQGVLDDVITSPDGKTIVAAYCNFGANSFVCEKENILLIDAQAHKLVGAPITIAKNMSNNVNVLLAYSPDGKTLAAAVDNSKIIVWDLQSNKLLKSLDQEYEANQMVFSPDSKTLFFASAGELNVFDISTLTLKATQKGQSANPIFSLALSADGKTIATSYQNGGITVLDAGTLAPVNKPQIASSGRVRSLAFSPDGKILAAGYVDQNIILWDLETGQKLTRPLFKHTAPVTGLSFSSDGKFLISSANEIVIWAMDPDAWVSKACRQAGRNFTQAEWEQYFPGETYQVTCQGFPAGK